MDEARQAVTPTSPDPLPRRLSDPLPFRVFDPLPRSEADQTGRRGPGDLGDKIFHSLTGSFAVFIIVLTGILDLRALPWLLGIYPALWLGIPCRHHLGSGCGSFRDAADDRRHPREIFSRPAYQHSDQPRIGHLSCALCTAMDSQSTLLLGGNASRNSQRRLWIVGALHLGARRARVANLAQSEFRVVSALPGACRVWRRRSGGRHHPGDHDHANHYRDLARLAPRGAALADGSHAGTRRNPVGSHLEGSSCLTRASA